MQLGAAHMLVKDWLQALPEPGPFLYLNAEDEEDELHRRFADVAAHYGASVGDLHGHLHLLALAGKDAVLGRPDRISGLIRPTPLLSKLTEAARDIRPKLIGLDTSADIFAGNENDRSQVRQFIGLLRGLAIAADAAVIIATHPSLTGIKERTGLSGNTAWHNSVRARAYMRPLKTNDDSEPDKSLRVVEFMKSNYGPLSPRPSPCAGRLASSSPSRRPVRSRRSPPRPRPTTPSSTCSTASPPKAATSVKERPAPTTRPLCSPARTPASPNESLKARWLGCSATKRSASSPTAKPRTNTTASHAT
jgi:hypothetical protein